jgi:hypothetical protein
MPHRRSEPSPILKHHHTAPAATVPQASSSNADLPFSSCTSSIYSTSVKFPPTPKLTSNRLTYPAEAYDRTPIVVTRNECALPRRHSRSLDEATSTSTTTSNHPRRSRSPRSHVTASTIPDGYFSATAQHAMDGPTPALSWSGSSSSESDDSDGVFTPPMCTPSEATPRAARFNALGLGLNGASSPAKEHNALAFLPHPPSPDREKKRRSATPAARTRRPLPTASFSMPVDDGCLGGF